MASAVATLAAYFTMTLLSYYFGKKYYPIPYNLKKIALYISLSILFSALSFYQFRAHYIFGLGLIAVLLMIIWVNEKTMLKQLLKKQDDD